jgi:ABC-type dipeptide/oligopeptide/nickel transport system permease component
MKVIIILLCIILGLVGLFMSVCGGFFTFAGLASGSGGAGLTAMALPFLLLGIGCIWGAVVGIRNAMRRSGNNQQR